MKHLFVGLTMCTALCCATPAALAQNTEEPAATARRHYTEGERLFGQQAYAAAAASLQAFMRLAAHEPQPDAAVMEAAYMLACTAYELHETGCYRKLSEYLDEYPDTPHAGRIRALMASVHYFAEEYDAALPLFETSHMEQLERKERNTMTFRKAVCYLKTGQPKEAAAWFETLRDISPDHAAECTYYLSYIRYTQRRYEEALGGFLSLQAEGKYREKVPYYIAEIHLIRKEYDKAEQVAQAYLANIPKGETNRATAEMNRVLGTVAYHRGKYREAMDAFSHCMQHNVEEAHRRDLLYMQGIACYQCGAYTQVPTLLGEVAATDDATSQNAWLHIGLAYLQLGEKSKARMAFGQAAASDADRHIKEQAAYNYALCIYETSYSAFGESVTAFEKFLNEFPQSEYTGKVSRCLVEVYLTTRSYEAALSSIERIRQPDATILEAKQKILFQLGTQEVANANFAKAISYFSRCIGPDNRLPQVRAEALYWRGESYYRAGQLSEAATDFRAYLSATAQQQSEMYALAYYNLGYISFRQKAYATAKGYFLQYLQTENGTNATVRADACNRTGDCYLYDRLFDEAKRYYTLAGQSRSDAGAYACYQLALIAGLQKDYAGKIALLEKLKAEYPSSSYLADALYEEGRAYVQSRDNRKAIATYRILTERYPESPAGRKAAVETGLLYYQNGEYREAIEAYKAVVTRYPGSEEARMAMQDLKSIYVDTDRVEEFAALSASLPGPFRLEHSEQDSLTYMAAEKLYMRGEKAAAQNSFTRYLQHFPEGAFCLNAHYYLCLTGKEQQDEEVALRHAGKVLEYPDSPYAEEVLLIRSQILYGQAKYAEALADYRQLQAKASTAEHRQTATTGIMRCAVLLHEDETVTASATELLADTKLAPELRNEALYQRAKARLARHENKEAAADLQLLAADTRTAYGAEAGYLRAQLLYDAADYAAAEKELLKFIEQSTPHTYWLARSFILLADVYTATGKKLDARQYLLSLQQSYQADDDIAGMIEERLKQIQAVNNK